MQYYAKTVYKNRNSSDYQYFLMDIYSNLKFSTEFLIHVNIRLSFVQIKKVAQPR